MALDSLDGIVLAVRTAARGHYARMLISGACYGALIVALALGNMAEFAGIGGAMLALGLVQARQI